ncbi:MAG: APC family permease [Chloroflexota bacterium]
MAGPEDRETRVEEQDVAESGDEREAGRRSADNGVEAVFNPELERREIFRGRRPGESYVRVVQPYRRHLRRTGRGRFVATPRVLEPTGGRFSRLLFRLRRFLIGVPLPSAHLVHERLSIRQALAVFASDALSSSAYAVEEILIVLVLAGAAAAQLTVPLSLGIGLLLLIVVRSYRMTIKAYPKGGGAYIVCMDNLGVLPALTAASSLLVGYLLTVAVSVSAGVAAMTSAAPFLEPYRVAMALGFVAVITLANLRGVRESAAIFAAPTYIYILVMFIMIGLGLYESTFGTPAAPPPPPAPFEPVTTLSLVLVLRAFAAGCSALTGTEAISDGVPAFREPQSQNAARTLTVMGATLGILFLGVAILANRFNILPSADQTVLSQIARTVFGDSPFYFTAQAATTLILVLAANTSFADFPRLSYFLARDRFMPRQFYFRGDRLAFSTGIIALGALSGLVIFAFAADTHALIPLYAVGVFISFTLSQSGMVRRWWRLRGPNWRAGLANNGIGAAATGFVAVILAITRFTEGAWMVLIVIPAFVWLLYQINAHYRAVAAQLELRTPDVPLPPVGEQVVVVPVPGLNRAVLSALAFARSISKNVTAVHVTDDLEQAERLKEEWDHWGGGIQLIVLESPYRSLMAPLMAYIDAIDQQDPRFPVTVVLPEFVPRHWWEWPLHNRSSLRLKAALFARPNTVVVDVPYHLGRINPGVGSRK